MCTLHNKNNSRPPNDFGDPYAPRRYDLVVLQSVVAEKQSVLFEFDHTSTWGGHFTLGVGGRDESAAIPYDAVSLHQTAFKWMD